MPRYPTPGEYQEALQFPSTAFTDPELKACEPDCNALGLPQAITGAFAAVFPVYTASGRHAVKCFLTEAPGLQARYRAIARYLASEQAAPAQRYFVPFDYQPEGVRVNEETYPLLKMGWAHGITLNRFVAEHLDEPEVLRGLADQWAQMLEDLEAAGIAHGDLQHGNVLVAPQDNGFRLVLVDYDTLYVPQLKRRRSAEAGHRNYAHPDRDERDFGPWLDRFAGLIIYIGLRACARKPDLWERYDTGENILFRAADFYEPAGSHVFKELAELDEVRTLVEALHTACLIDPHAVPSLAEIRSGVRVNRTIHAAVHSVRGLGRKQERGDEPRTLLERAFLPGLFVLAAVAIALAIAGTSLAATLLVLGGVAGFGSLAAWGYMSQPVVRRRKRLRQEARFFERAVERLRLEANRLEAEHRSTFANMDKLMAEHLATLRERALEERLKHHFIGEVAQLPGVPHRLVVRLKMHGIRTAYHATDDRLATVTEVGDESRARVSRWRADLVSRYAAELPERLSPAEERRLERYVRQRADTLRAEIERVMAKRQVQERERAEVLERQAGLPQLTFGCYLRYLLGLGRLPSSQPLPPRPVLSSPDHIARARAVPVHHSDDTPWWRQS